MIKEFQIPEKPMLKCSGFTYFGAKLFNKLPSIIKETVDPNTFKNLTKSWIWDALSVLSLNTFIEPRDV